MRIISPKTAKRILSMMGWRGMDEAIPAPKCIILGAPHTSIWDFVISWLYYRSVGGNAKVMIKKGFFKWPLGPILRHLGGIPVDRTTGGGAHLVRQMIEEFEKDEYFQLAIAPEGTRRPVKRWKGGFHLIAKAPEYRSSSATSTGAPRPSAPRRSSTSPTTWTPTSNA